MKIEDLVVVVMMIGDEADPEREFQSDNGLLMMMTNTRMVKTFAERRGSSEIVQNREDLQRSKLKKSVMKNQPRENEDWRIMMRVMKIIENLVSFSEFLSVEIFISSHCLPFSDFYYTLPNLLEFVVC